MLLETLVFTAPSRKAAYLTAKMISLVTVFTTPCTLIVMWASYSHGLHCNFTGCSNPCYIVIFVAVAPGLVSVNF
jgi:hypothetical protein